MISPQWSRRTPPRFDAGKILKHAPLLIPPDNRKHLKTRWQMSRLWRSCGYRESFTSYSKWAESPWHRRGWRPGIWLWWPRCWDRCRRTHESRGRRLCAWGLVSCSGIKVKGVGYRSFWPYRHLFPSFQCVHTSCVHIFRGMSRILGVYKM